MYSLQLKHTSSITCWLTDSITSVARSLVPRSLTLSQCLLVLLWDRWRYSSVLLSISIGGLTSVTTEKTLDILHHSRSALSIVAASPTLHHLVLPLPLLHRLNLLQLLLQLHCLVFRLSHSHELLLRLALPTNTRWIPMIIALPSLLHLNLLLYT